VTYGYLRIQGWGEIVAPNAALRRLLADSGWTEAQLAKAVNAAGAEAGLALRYDRSSVSHWLTGRRPWGPVPGLLAETLSRALGRTITIADTGLAASEPDGPPARDTATTLAELGDGRRLHAAYSVAALSVPDWPHAIVGNLITSAPNTAPHEPRLPSQTWPGVAGPGVAGARLAVGQVAAAEQMAGIFCDTDATFGGGRARTALAAYLAHQVVPCLRATARPALRTRMFTVATQLTYLCAFMCFDDERHALAQRYYRSALDLAAENGDAAAYAIGLRALSVQARALGHHRHAIHLAELAASTSRKRFPPERQAFFAGQVAVAAAANGDRTTALSALRAAERLLSRAASTSVPTGLPMGSYHPAALAHQRAAVCALLGDRAEAISALSESVRHRPPGERRSRAIITARLAELQLATGHLEEAVATWYAFLDDYPYLRSGRATAALRTLRSRLRPYARNAAAGRLLGHAATLVS
jgi:tetratricopeptide (TPR) repeat protein